RYLGMDSSTPPPMPILVRISDLSNHFEQSKSNPLRLDDRKGILEHLVAFCKANQISMSTREWEKWLSSGNALLLVDGLDETPDDAVRERLFDIFRDACKAWPKTRIVVTSRPIQTHALQETGFALATIDTFNEVQIRTFVRQWVAALHQVAPGKTLSGVAGRYEEKLFDAIIQNHSIRLLASNPIMLTCLCVVHWNETHLPEGRSRVYRAVLRWLIASRHNQRAAGFADRFAQRGLARIALGMMVAPEGRHVRIDLEHGARLVEPLVERDYPELTTSQDRRELGRRWLRFECLGSGIVEELAGNRIQFWHLTFQEYLAALQLAWLKDDPGESPDSGENWWPIVKGILHNPQWRETVDLLPGCLLDEGGEGRVDQLLERVLNLRGTAPSLAEEASIFGVMSCILNTMTVYDYNPVPKILSAFEEMRQRVLEIFTIEGSKKVPIETRIEVAEALGQGGDPRLSPGKIQYIEIPGMKGNKLGKYPVTVEEYQRFVDARGYEEQKNWDEEGRQYKRERNWEAPGGWEDQLKTPNRPVVHVSWYEANAYCCWLSSVRGSKMRLPNVSEWEAAAKPEKGEYPWGEAEPDPELANFGDHVNKPTPVGIYPRGAGPGGHMDLAGNVWEWCADHASSIGEEYRALRGGSCWNSVGSLRFSTRSGLPAGIRGHFIGFRVLSAPASTVCS
ncbi:MAG: SUMF1/EgtB/PvdO family nonheme iron enzyme, partial [Planctomycetota bacterium]